MVTPDVGRTGLMYSASWKAKTEVCRVMPTRSPRGAMMGMVSTAGPSRYSSISTLNGPRSPEGARGESLVK